mmetsp:Transcript_12062/g.44053  ORF Transcript_12062/g.44053 Transcript_12062/m.44053 type:complete len:83 (+) Transcript_12062:1539-1787(+)
MAAKSQKQLRPSTCNQKELRGPCPLVTIDACVCLLARLKDAPEEMLELDVVRELDSLVGCKVLAATRRVAVDVHPEAITRLV